MFFVGAKYFFIDFICIQANSNTFFIIGVAFPVKASFYSLKNSAVGELKEKWKRGGFAGRNEWREKLLLFSPLLQGGDDSVCRNVGSGVVSDDFF